MKPSAVLLCAGVGQRLRPLTDDRPKALVRVGTETMLGRAVRLLVDAGVEHFVVATGYREDAVRASFAGFAHAVTFCPNPAFDRTQNSVSLWHCREAVEGRPFFKLDGDLLFDRRAIGRLFAKGGDLVAAVAERPSLGAEEMKVMAEGDAIQAFGKGLDPRSCLGESIGIELVREEAGRALFQALSRTIEAGRTDLYYEDVYNDLITQGLDCRVADVTDLGTVEVDTPEDLAQAERLVASGLLGD